MKSSRQLNNHDNTVRRRVDKRELMKRIIALILCAVMLIGVAYYVIVLFASHSHAVGATPTLSDENDVKISVGLMYGDGVTVSYQMSTVGGLTFGLQGTKGDNKSFTTLWSTASSAVIIAADATVKKNPDGMYYKSVNPGDYTFGGYNVEVIYDFGSFAAAKNFADTYAGVLYTEYGCNVFPAYVNGEYRVRIGNFFSNNDATAKLSQLRYYLSEMTLQTVAPSDTGLMAIDPTTGAVMFEFNCGNSAILGVKPTTDGKYLKAPSGNVYSGVFALKRYINTSGINTVDGVSVINVLPLEDYVAGVLPYEVFNSWPIETLKAFAIAVRSFTVSSRGLHSSGYGFDICSSAHCQVYHGMALVNDKVKTAVSETKGKVMTYNGEIVQAFYSSSVGGSTVGSKDTWGYEDLPYLKVGRTPWEDYYNHENGFWIKEVSPEALLVYLRDTKKYTELKGTKIVDVKIVDLAKDSTYVKTIEFVDDLGNRVRVTNAAKVREVLGAYVKSANFVVGKGSVDYTVDIVRDGLASSVSIDDGIVSLADAPAYGQIDANGRIPVKMINYSVRTSSDVFVSSIDMYVSVITGSGVQQMGSSTAYVITRDNADIFDFDAPVVPPVAPPDTEAPPTNPVTPPTTPTTPPTGDEDDNIFSVVQNKTATASNSNNFIFVGKGSGHGVGMSQYGAYDLAKIFGYDYAEILNAYFKDIEIVDYKTID